MKNRANTFRTLEHLQIRDGQHTVSTSWDSTPIFQLNSDVTLQTDNKAIFLHAIPCFFFVFFLLLLMTFCTVYCTVQYIKICCPCIFCYRQERMSVGWFKWWWKKIKYNSDKQWSFLTGNHFVGVMEDCCTLVATMQKSYFNKWPQLS